ncbi:MAG: aldehyde dehydrogenase family protein [Bdellovibrionales bacterium]
MELSEDTDTLHGNTIHGLVDQSGPTVAVRPLPEDIPQVLSCLRTAQSAWSKVSLRDRLRIIQQLRRQLAQRDLDLARAVQKHRLTNVAEILAGEILPLAEACLFLEKRAKKILQPRKLGRNGRPFWLAGVWSEIHREPLGVILILGPANYPLFLAGCQLLQALVAGNAVALKPGTGGTDVLRLLLDLLVEGGLPRDLVYLLPEEPGPARAMMNCGVDKVILTGSAETGKRVLAQSVGTLTPVVAELSGCDVCFVLEDADLDRVCRALAFGLRWNRGETCIAPRRVFVAKKLAGQLEQKLIARMKTLTEHWLPSQNSARAIPLVRQALRQGARLAIGSIDTDQGGITPTLLVNTSPDMALLQEDVFAPILSMIEFENEQEALQQSKRCPYALGATVFGSEGRARELARSIRAGVVIVNDVIVPTADPRLPFAGRGRSGFGVTRGAEGLREMTAIKAMVCRRGSCPHLEDPQPSDVALFHHYLQAAHGRGFFKRFREWISLAGVLLARIRNGNSEGDKRE